MERNDLATEKQRGGRIDAGQRGQARRCRLVPPAITPVGLADVAAGVHGHLRGAGRDEFRRQIEQFLDADDSATYTSFRRTLAGCFQALATSGDTDRREVLIPAFCSSDYPDVIESIGLQPVRYDVDPGTLACETSSIEAEIGQDTLAVVSINVLGYGSPIADLAARCDRHGAYLVEALGYALGTTYEGARLGTFGDCAVLNFQQGKPIPVGGGMVTSRTPALEFDDRGRSAIQANVATMAGYALLSHPRPYYAFTRLKERFDGIGGLADRATTHPGSPSDSSYAPPFETISDFQGTVAGRVFGRLDDHRQHRERTARYYADQLADCPGVDHVVPVDGLAKLQHVRFPLLAATEPLRDRIGSALGSAGVQTAKLYDWPVIDPTVFPGAGALQRRILTLPTHPYVDDRDRRLIVETVRETVGRSDDPGSRRNE
ncbi:DegT/DnrJ/EryC1/StrS family aminotransferase [Haloarcula sp. GH36]|uniref:DegT/DnrJ/EryC1/StrS family aminotransferase n=1 Tax=Haloarcula montana TaxID=3111776 RepID=UPI002D781D0A|nr:DegT/DnrJ/EryC1/StrS family aminotransferase [Haloarcula sp. GH36]